MNDTYKTVAGPSGDILYKEKGSKFIGYVYPITNIEEVKEFLADLKKQHHAARHWCYAWRMGIDGDQYRVNDDGEPGNSAGQPIYGQIKAMGLTNILVVVVRYFGGTKLGVGGLIQAYKTAAKWTLDDATLVDRIITVNFRLNFEYSDMDKIRRIIKEEKLKLHSENLALNCEYVLQVRKRDVDRIKDRFEGLRCLNSLKIFD